MISAHDARTIARQVLTGHGLSLDSMPNEVRQTIIGHAERAARLGQSENDIRAATEECVAAIRDVQVREA